MNNDVLRLHERNATNFETGDILNDAVNISEQRKINDIACLQFEYPMDDKARLIKENMLLTTNGRIYEIVRITRKMDGRDIVQVTAKDMFSRRAQNTFLPNVPDMIGKKTSDVIKKALKTATDFSLYTDEELSAMGMEWVGNDKFLIDFFSTDKTTLWDFLHTVIENSGRGEIYSNGYKFALVERIGCDRGVRLTLDKNMQNIEIERSTEDMITKLYPFGSEDLTIKHAKLDNGQEYGKEYILSPNAEIYGVHEGYRDYSDYTEADKVYANALWEFDPDNEERIDIPQITITGKLIDLSKLEEYGDIEKIELGDTVHVYDIDGQEHVQRVIEGTWYPYEARETVISIGHMRRDMFFTLYQLQHKKRELEAVQTANKQIATRKMQGVVNTDRNGVQSDNELLKIVGDLLTIYNNSGKKRLELGNVDGQFALNIYDETGKLLKIKLGDHGDNYAFAIYDGKGNPAIYMNEQGQVLFTGILETYNKASIGKELTIGAIDESISQILFQGETNATEITNDDINKVFTISPSFGGDLVIDENGIKFDGNKLLTSASLQGIKYDISELKERVSVLENNKNALQI